MNAKTTITLATLTASLYGLSAFAEEKHDHDHEGHNHAEHAQHGQDAEDDHSGHDHDHDHDHGHDHGPSITAGPNNGRVLIDVEPHLEFLVTPEGLVRMTALDANLKPIPMTDQKVTVVAGDRAKPTILTFAKDGETLLSKDKLPEGKMFDVVAMIRGGGAEKSIKAKFNLNLNDCPTCDNLKYACECDHAHSHGEHDHGAHEGHDHGAHEDHDHEGHDHAKEEVKK